MRRGSQKGVVKCSPRMLVSIVRLMPHIEHALVMLTLGEAASASERLTARRVSTITFVKITSFNAAVLYSRCRTPRPTTYSITRIASSLFVLGSTALSTVAA